jgi:hypothetical protein
MEIEQKMARLLVEIKPEIRTNRVEIKTNQAKADKNLLQEGMLAKLDAYHQRMVARMDSQLEKIETCLRTTEATDLEAESVE